MHIFADAMAGWHEAKVRLCSANALRVPLWTFVLFVSFVVVGSLSAFGLAAKSLALAPVLLRCDGPAATARFRGHEVGRYAAFVHVPRMPLGFSELIA